MRIATRTAAAEQVEPKAYPAARRAAPFSPVPMFETMEDRRLLSASVGDASGPAITPLEARLETALLSDFYSGSLKYKKVEGLAKLPKQQVIVDFDSRTSSGELTGNLVSAGIGDEAFIGQLDGRRFTLKSADDNSWYLEGKISKTGGAISAKLYNVDENRVAKVKAKAQSAVAQAAYTTSQTVFGTLASTSFTTTTTTGGTNTATTTNGSSISRARASNPYVDAEGDLHFVGSYSGSVTLGFAPEQNGVDRINFTNFQTFSATMNITSETDSDLLTGTLSVATLGNYNVSGIVKLDDMTLIITPAAAGTGGTGVMHLHVSRNGLNYSGRFEQEANETWGFGTASFNRPATVTGTNTGGTNTGGTTTGGTTTNGGTTVVTTTGNGTGSTASLGNTFNAGTAAGMPSVPGGGTTTGDASNGTNNTIGTGVLVESDIPGGRPVGNTPGVDIANQPDTEVPGGTDNGTTTGNAVNTPGVSIANPPNTTVPGGSSGLTGGTSTSTNTNGVLPEPGSTTTTTTGTTNTGNIPVIIVVNNDDGTLG